jgi:hypothetical protein
MRPVGTSSQFSMCPLGQFLKVPDRDRWGAIARLSLDYTEMRAWLRWWDNRGNLLLTEEERSHQLASQLKQELVKSMSIF